MFNWDSGRKVQGNVIEPDDSKPVDWFLEDSMTRYIYEAWDEDEFGALVDYGGGVQAITVKMVLNAGEEFLTRVHGVGPKRAQVIMEKLSDSQTKVY